MADSEPPGDEPGSSSSCGVNGDAETEEKSAEASLVPRESGYSYAHFVERFKHPSAQAVVNEIRDFVNDFPANLSRLAASRRIQGFLKQLTPKLLQADAFSSEDGEVAGEGLEKFVVLKLYKLLFRHDPADIREDERAEQLLREARSKAKTSPMQEVVAKFTSKQREAFEAAAAELRKVEQYRAPRDKLSCFANAIRLSENLLVERVFTADANGSHWITLLAALILKASPSNLYSNLEFTTSFRSRMTPEERKSLADFASAFVLLCGSSQRLTSLELNDGRDGDKASPALPVWLMDAGVTFNFEDRNAEDLLFGEVEELLDEYHKMISALRDLNGGRLKTFDT